ncbi:S8 family peptidase [Prevotella nigrescens]|uniref:S8 family peptidase n=1 Tax=Prevotella nigrescens TaxID=28133 RepID=UPI00361820EE
MNKYKHIILPETIKKALKYSPRGSGGGGLSIPVRNRQAHAEYLQRKFDAARVDDTNVKQQMEAISLPARSGIYLEFASAPNYDLVSKSLEDQKAGIRLLNIRQVKTEDNQEQTFATIYIPHGKENRLLEKLHKYATEELRNGKPKNDTLFRSIENINVALLKALWTDRYEDFPTDHNDWYEVWIRTSVTEDIVNQHNRFIDSLQSLDIHFKEDSVLTFPERTVFLVYANIDALTKLLGCSDQLAELRSGRVLTGFLFDEYRNEQQEWVEDLHNRVQFNPNTNSVICVLDSGANNGHPLLEPIIPERNCGSVVGEGLADRDGHGTRMCGTVIYGDMSSCLASTQKIQIDNQVGSIKLYPNGLSNPKEAWGFLTEQAVLTSEIIFPHKTVCYCMAITAEDSEQGKPTSWSGAVDSITYNKGNTSRLFMVSAGNIRDINNLDKEIVTGYPNRNSLRPIQNPAQAWNGLTVGAFTNIVAIDSPDLKNYDRVAPSGGISPFSRTSSLWGKGALIKPEVMFEGGNLYKTNNPQIPFSSHQDLELMTTSKNYQKSGYFDTINATSAATALAANFAGKLQARYPHLWAESIRGLIVHSAKWTSCMEMQFPVKNRGDMEKRLRHCGYGVPSEERAFYSTENGLTYVAQEIIQPFIKERGDNSPKINEMNFFELPWPREVLEQLAEANVTMRVTLSYFIEPAPGEIGWKDKYRYASCGLRFDVNKEDEDQKAFQLRINKLIEAEENEERGKNDSSRWLIGSDNRNKGSIHSDELNLTAAQLAACNLIAVYPIGGWWKTRTNLRQYNNKLRYSLIVSLDTPIENVDLYNIVKTKIETMINIPVKIEAL